MFSNIVNLIFTFGIFNCFIFLTLGLPYKNETEEERAWRLQWTWWSPFPILVNTPDVMPLECSSTNSLLNIGTCFEDHLCTANGGSLAGTCATGGSCCVFPKSCGAIIQQSRAWFVNDHFPEVSKSLGSCEITIQRENPNIKQLRIDLSSLDLNDGNSNSKSISRTVCDGSHFKILINNQEIHRLCQDNSGQHMFIDFPEDEELKIKIEMSPKSRQYTNGFTWKVFLTQLNETQSAPKKCLQYYEDETSTIKSLNLMRTENSLNYDICFRSVDNPKEEQSCQRQFSNIEIQEVSSRVARSVLQTDSRKYDENSVFTNKFSIESLKNKLKNNANSDISNVINQVSETLKQAQLNSPSIPLEQLFTEIKSDKKDVTTVRVESTDQSPDDEMEVFTDTSKEKFSGETAALPILNSMVNPGVIDQIHQVVKQLQENSNSNSNKDAFTLIKNHNNLLTTSRDIESFVKRSTSSNVGIFSMNRDKYDSMTTISSLDENTMTTLNNFDQAELIPTTDTQSFENDIANNFIDNSEAENSMSLDKNKLDVDDIQQIMKELTRGDILSTTMSYDMTTTPKRYTSFVKITPAFTTKHSTAHSKSPIDHDLLQQILKELDSGNKKAGSSSSFSAKKQKIKNNFMKNKTKNPIIETTTTDNPSTDFPTMKPQFINVIDTENAVTKDNLVIVSFPEEDLTTTQMIFNNDDTTEDPNMAEITLSTDLTRNNFEISKETNRNSVKDQDGIQWLILDEIESGLINSESVTSELPADVMVSTGIGFTLPPATSKRTTTTTTNKPTEDIIRNQINSVFMNHMYNIKKNTPKDSPSTDAPSKTTFDVQLLNDIANVAISTFVPEAEVSTEQTTSPDVQEVVTRSENSESETTKATIMVKTTEKMTTEATTIVNINEEPCENTFLEVNNNRFCGSLTRSQLIAVENPEIFTNVERMSISEAESTGTQIRYKMDYATVCSNSIEDKEPVKNPTKKVTLLQYLLGWYR